LRGSTSFPVYEETELVEIEFSLLYELHYQVTPTLDFRKFTAMATLLERYLKDKVNNGGSVGKLPPPPGG